MSMKVKGSVFMISLWVVTILAVCAIGLGHRAGISVRLADYQKERLRAYCTAKAGLARAVIELARDRDSTSYDTLQETWSTGRDPQTNDPLFENQPLGEGSSDTFTVSYLYDREQKIYLCMADQERRININKIDSFRQQQFVLLLKSLGWDDSRAKEFVDTLADWIDLDTKTAAGAQEDPAFKNAQLVTLEELCAVMEQFYLRHNEDQPREKARQMHAKLADYVTIYTDGKVNINTASSEVLKIVIDAMLKVVSVPSVIESDSEGIVVRITALRQAGGYFERDDPSETKAKLTASGGELTTGQENILSQLAANGLITASSNTFMIDVAASTAKKITRHISAVVNRTGTGHILSWHET